MKQAFKEAYERELLLLKERAAVFADDHPALAGRLGGLLEENLDPAIAGLLEGTAFLAARVQLNIEQQFRTFSSEMLSQLCPEMTAPLPSVMLVQATTADKPAELAKGRRLACGEYLEASFTEATRRVTCRYRLAEPVEFWPVELSDAVFHNSSTPLSALGCDDIGGRGPEAGGRTGSGLVITLQSTDTLPLSALGARRLPIHFVGATRQATALYEQVFSNLRRVTLRWLDKNGDPVLRRLPTDGIRQVGFDPDYPLFGQTERLFPGFSLLLEYFAFPGKFLGMCLENIDTHLRDIPAQQVQLILEFDKPHELLSSHFDKAQLGLFCAPAVNLFEDEARPITLDKRRHRLAVTPNRSSMSQYEVHRVLSVRAQYPEHSDKIEVLPLYAMPAEGRNPRQSLYYTLERTRRGLTLKERRLGGTRVRYEGTETWLTLYEPPERDPARLLLVRTLCSNRHLPEILPISETNFLLLEDRTVKLRCVSGPTPPREAAAELEYDSDHRMQAGDNYWRLISYLSLSYRGFLGPDGKGNIAALREMLRLFSDVSDHLSETQITGLSELRASSVVRTIRRPDGYHPARGIKVTLVFDEAAFDSGTIIVLGAVLDRFLADYAAINSFTQCEISNRKGKVMKIWPPRGGSGPLL